MFYIWYLIYVILFKNWSARYDISEIMVYDEANEYVFVAISMLVIGVFHPYITFYFSLHYCLCPFKHAIIFFCNNLTQMIWTWFAPKRKFVHCLELELAEI